VPQGAIGGRIIELRVGQGDSDDDGRPQPDPDMTAMCRGITPTLTHTSRCMVWHIVTAGS